MTQQHLHAQIGDIIRASKKRLYSQLKEGVDLEVAISDFIIEVSNKLRDVAKNLKP